jgi:hypothetical protein
MLRLAGLTGLAELVTDVGLIVQSPEGVLVNRRQNQGRYDRSRDHRGSHY